jgi:hypothetical protein
MIMEMSLSRVNAKRSQKFENVLQECPDVQCAYEAMESYKEVNREVDKFYERMSVELHACIQKEKAYSPQGMIDCFSKF